MCNIQLTPLIYLICWLWCWKQIKFEDLVFCTEMNYLWTFMLWWGQVCHQVHWTKIQSMKRFHWVNNPIASIDGVDHLLRAINCHPSLEDVHLRNMRGPNINSYNNILCSLFGGENQNITHMDLFSNNIKTMGGTDLPDFLATTRRLESVAPGTQ